MNLSPWTPRHKVILLRPDLKSGEFSMESFAADLYDGVIQHCTRLAYEDPVEFFPGPNSL
jgi:hypothetical protein